MSLTCMCLLERTTDTSTGCSKDFQVTRPVILRRVADAHTTVIIESGESPYVQPRHPMKPVSTLTANALLNRTHGNIDYDLVNNHI